MTVQELRDRKLWLQNQIGRATDPNQKKAWEDELEELDEYEDTTFFNPYKEEAHKKGESPAELKSKETEEWKNKNLEGASGVVARGNQGDNAIQNPGAPDTAEVTKRHLEEKASVQTPENMEPATFVTDPVEFEAIPTKEVVNKMEEVNEIAQPEKGDTKVEKEAKQKYKDSTRSIWAAYKNGDIDKETAGYFTIDAIATLAKNLGREVGNVGAQFTGGAIDDREDQSKWQQRQNELFGEEVQMEKEDLGGPAGRQAQSEVEGITAQQLSNARNKIINQYTPAQMEAQIEMLNKELEMAGINIDMANSKKAVIDYIQAKDGWESNPWYVYLVSSLAQSGATGTAGSVINGATGIVNTLIGALK